MKHNRHRQVVRSALGERKEAPNPCRRCPVNNLHGGQVDIDPVQSRIRYELPLSGVYAGVVLLVEISVIVELILKRLPKGIVRVPRTVKLPAVLGAEPRTLCICLRFSDTSHSGKMCTLATFNRPGGPTHRRMEVRPAARGWNATSAKLLARAFARRVRIPLWFEAKPRLKYTLNNGKVKDTLAPVF